MIGYRKNIWTLTECILDIVIKARRETLSMREGLRVRRVIEDKYARRNAMLEMAWELFVTHQNPVQHQQFLTAASHIFDGFGNDLICADIAQIQEFQHVNTYEDVVRMFPDIHSYRIRDDQGITHVLHRTGCLTCNCKYLATYMILPCYHWAGCELCIQQAMQLAIAQGAILHCSVCNIATEWFVRLDEERKISK